MRVCTSCLSVGPPKKTGAGAVTWIVGVVFILLGLAVAWPLLLVVLVLGIYQSVSRKIVCAKCGAKDPIPLDTPRAQQMLAQAQGQQPRVG